MNKNQQALRNEPIGKLLFKFSIPAVLGMLLNSIYNIVDKLFIGNQADIINTAGDVVHVGTLSLAGLNIAFPIQMLIIALATMMGIGASSLISRYLGAKEFHKADVTFGNSLMMIIVLSAILTTVGTLFTEPILRIFGATDAIMPYALAYTKIVFYGTIFFSVTVSMNNIIRAEGNAIMAMVVMIVGTVLNIPLDYLFVIIFKMGVEGAAIATIIAQFLGFILITTYFLSGKSYFKIKANMFIVDWDIIGKTFAIGLPSLVRTGAFTLFSIVINNAIKQYGLDVHFAIMGVLSPVVSFVMMPSIGIAQGMQPIVGYNFGAKQVDRSNKALKISALSASMISIIGFILIFIFIKPIVGAFIQESETVKLGAKILRLIILGVPTLGLQIVASGYFQSIGKAIPALVISSARQVLILIPLILILTPIYGVDSIWWSMPLADYASCAMAIIWLSIEMRKEKKIFTEPV